MSCSMCCSIQIPPPPQLSQGGLPWERAQTLESLDIFGRLRWFCWLPSFVWALDCWCFGSISAEMSYTRQARWPTLPNGCSTKPEVLQRGDQTRELAVNFSNREKTNITYPILNGWRSITFGEPKRSMYHSFWSMETTDWPRPRSKDLSFRFQEFSRIPTTVRVMGNFKTNCGVQSNWTVAWLFVHFSLTSQFWRGNEPFNGRLYHPNCTALNIHGFLSPGCAKSLKSRLHGVRCSMVGFSPRNWVTLLLDLEPQNTSHGQPTLGSKLQTLHKNVDPCSKSHFPASQLMVSRFEAA